MTASLHIRTGLREGKTYLRSCFFTTPLKIANITENRTDKALHLMLMSSSPGILDGDNYELKIELDKECCLQLQTQSYQRLFNMKKGASQNIEVVMSDNSCFYYLPHPSVPHEASNFAAANKIYLSDRCKLIWGEVVTCGRKLNGEKFKFTRYKNLTEIFLHERLVVKENLLITPATIDINAIGQFEGYSHQASLIYIDAEAQVDKVISEVSGWLSGVENISFGVSALAVNGVIIRLLGYKAEQLYNCLQNISHGFYAKTKLSYKEVLH